MSAAILPFPLVIFADADVSADYAVIPRLPFAETAVPVNPVWVSFLRHDEQDEHDYVGVLSRWGKPPPYPSVVFSASQRLCVRAYSAPAEGRAVFVGLPACGRSSASVVP
jgi:hypothetical protein